MLAMLLSLMVTSACTPVLEISPEIGGSLRFPLDKDGRFSVTYWHSMYLAPVTEDFVVDSGRQIRLVKVHSPSGAVLEYLGLDGPGAEHAIERHFPSIGFRVAMQNPQTLVIREQRWSFNEFGGPGARLVFSPRTDCLGQTNRTTDS